MALRETRRLLTPDDAQDAAQEAVLRAWRSAHSCCGTDPDPWVRTIARREAYRIIGRRQADRLPDDYELGDQRCQLEGAERRLDIVSGAARLSQDERQALLLRYWAGRSDRQIATLLEAPVGTIEVRIHRAHKKLAHALESHGYGG